MLGIRKQKCYLFSFIRIGEVRLVTRSYTTILNRFHGFIFKPISSGTAFDVQRMVFPRRYWRRSHTEWARVIPFDDSHLQLYQRGYIRVLRHIQARQSQSYPTCSRLSLRMLPNDLVLRYVTCNLYTVVWLPSDVRDVATHDI